MRTTRPDTPVKISTLLRSGQVLEGQELLDLGLCFVPGTEQVGGLRPIAQWHIGTKRVVHELEQGQWFQVTEYQELIMSENGLAYVLEINP